MTNEEIDQRIEAWQNGDSNDAEIDGLTEIVRELQEEREKGIRRDRTVYDPHGDVFYEPFISEDGRVGYRVGRTDDRADVETFIYFNPSVADSADTPNVFVYVGRENDRRRMSRCVSLHSRLRSSGFDEQRHQQVGTHTPALEKKER